MFLAKVQTLAANPQRPESPQSLYIRLAPSHCWINFPPRKIIPEINTMLCRLPLLFAAATGALAAPADVWTPPSPPPDTDVVAVNEGLGDPPHGPYRAVFERNLPLLEVDKTWCCYPYPAISLYGKYNKGMDPRYSAIEACQRFDISDGQIYVRGFKAQDIPLYGGHYAIMYAWYFPKIQESPKGGHRHDWQQLVQWYKLKDPKRPDTNPDNYNFVGVSYSTPDGYKYQRQEDFPRKSDTGQIFVKYGRVGTKRGLEIERAQAWMHNRLGQRWMLSWDELSQNQAAVDAANNPNSFDKNVAPFSDYAVKGHLEAAWKAANP